MSYCPTLSVVLPNFNHELYLAAALDALLSQDCAADEIIVVDDCSSDGSRDIVARYAVTNPSIRLFVNEKNQGAIASLSRGLAEARGQYIYFGAADDFLMPGFFSSAIKMLQANPGAGLFCGDAVLIDGISGHEIGIRPPVRPRLRAGFIGPQRFAELLRRNDSFIVTGAAVFRRDAVVSAGGFNARLASLADGYLTRVVTLTHGFCYSPTTVLTWRIFKNSLSRTESTKLDLTRHLLGNAEALMAEHPAFPSWYGSAFARRWHFLVSRLGVLENPINRDLLMDMGARNAIDRALFSFFLKAFSRQFARILILGWLWLRLRPFSLIDLVLTAMTRNRLFEIIAPKR